MKVPAVKEVSRRGYGSLKEQLRRWVRKRIASGELRAGDRLPSINAFSGDLQISRETVRQALDSLVLQGMLFAEQGKGYFVAERGKRLHRICLIGRMDGVYMKPIYEGIMDRLNRRGSMMLLNLQSSDESLNFSLELLSCHHAAERLFIVPVRGEEQLLHDRLAPYRRHFKIAWLDRAPAKTQDATFLCDYGKCVEIAMRHFAATGASDCFYFSRNPEDHSVFSQMRTAFKVHSKSFNMRPAFFSDLNLLHETVVKTVAKKIRPAIFAETDLEALFLQSNLLSKGLKVPENVQIIGCDNFELTDSAAPRISTVDPGFTEIGQRAGEWAMADHFENPLLATQQFTAAPRLILKESTLPAKS